MISTWRELVPDLGGRPCEKIEDNPAGAVHERPAPLVPSMPPA